MNRAILCLVVMPLFGCIDSTEVGSVAQDVGATANTTCAMTCGFDFECRDFCGGTYICQYEGRKAVGVCVTGTRPAVSSSAPDTSLCTYEDGVWYGCGDSGPTGGGGGGDPARCGGGCLIDDDCISMGCAGDSTCRGSAGSPTKYCVLP